MLPIVHASNSSGLKISGLVLLIVAITCMAYSGLVHNGFIAVDDIRYVIDNDMIKHGFSVDTFRWAFTTRTDGNWFPLTWLSYVLDISLAGSSARTIHLGNLTYHLLNSSLVLLLLYNLTGALYRSAFVAELFALHPLHVESVAWASERKDVLSAFFLLLTLLAYSRFCTKGGRLWYCISLLLFSCGLMAKSMLVTVPLLLLLLDFWPFTRFKRVFSKECVRLIVEKIPFMLLAVVVAAATYRLQNSAITPYAASPLSINVKNAFVSYVRYIEKTLNPQHLAFLYPFDPHISWYLFTASVVLMAGISFWVVMGRHSRPALFVGWFWYVIALLPVIGIVRVGDQAMADRYTYIPHIGLLMVLVWGVAEVRKIVGNVWLVRVLVVISLTLLTSQTWRQVQRWRSTESLFSYTIAVTENNWVAYAVLGYDCLARLEYDKAQELLQKSLTIKPNNPLALTKLGIIQTIRGNRGAARELFEKAANLEPQNAIVHYQLGMLLLDSSDHAGALHEYEVLEKLDHELARQLLVLITIRKSTN